MKIKKHKNRKNCFIASLLSCFNNESGQSLIEIMIALAIGVVLIGGASISIVVVLQSSQTSQIQQHATALSQEIIEKGQVYTTADWSNVYDLQKGSSTVYFFSASSTKLFHIEGKEGVVSGDIQGGLIGHWKLDEATGTTAYDFSGNGNHGILESNPTRATSTCKVGYCINFDGVDDYVEIVPTSPITPYQQNRTVSVWFNAGSFPASDNMGLVITGNSVNPLTPMWELNIKAGNGLDIYHGGNHYTVVSSGINTGEWHHFVYTYNHSAGVFKGYVDGIEKLSQSVSDADYTRNNIYLATGYFGKYEGFIDDARIYNRVLSADEVEHLYNSTAFNRYFYIENVCRTNDANYELAGVAPCDSGSIDDPSTQRITGVVEWSGKDKISNFSLIRYLTRWRNDVFHQTDWSGGSGQEGPVEKSSDRYASSTDIDFSSLGEIKIKGI